MVIHCPFCGEKAGVNEKTCGACNRNMSRSCPYCAEDISASASLCKYCGEKVDRKRPDPVKPAPGIQFIDDKSSTSSTSSNMVAWEDTSRSYVSRWWGTTLSSVFSPIKFYQSVPQKSGARWPIGFVYGLFAQLFIVAVMCIGTLSLISAVNGRPISEHTAMGSMTMMALMMPALLIAVPLGLFVSSLVMHVPLLLLGAKGGFQATMRTIAYSSGVLMIPILGLPLNLLLHYQGYRNLHSMGRITSFLATMAPMAIGLAAFVIAVKTGVINCPCSPAGPVNGDIAF